MAPTDHRKGDERPRYDEFLPAETRSVTANHRETRVHFLLIDDGVLEGSGVRFERDGRAHLRAAEEDRFTPDRAIAAVDDVPDPMTTLSPACGTLPDTQLAAVNQLPTTPVFQI
jgi:hypothetical protein